MNRRLILLLAALGFLFSMIVYDGWLATRIRASRAVAAALARRFADIEEQIRFQGSTDAHPPGSPVSGVGSRHQGDTGNAKTVGTSLGSPSQDPRQLIASDPKLRATYLASYRDGLDTQYGLLIRILGLSPAGEARFKQLMADREANALQVAATAADQGLDPNDPEMKALSNQLNRSNWTDLKQLIGPTGMSELRQFWSEWPIVTLVQNFGGNIPGSTLTVSQAQQLLPVLSAASQRDSTGTVIRDTINVQQALTRISQIGMTNAPHGTV